MGTLFGIENIQDAIGQALIDHGQTAFPGQELPLHFDTQALEYFDCDVVVDAFGLPILQVHIGCPGLGDDAQLLTVGKSTQASEQHSGQ
ncbi:hypothetical protein D3C73_1514930 [compost metagenome]